MGGSVSASVVGQQKCTTYLGACKQLTKLTLCLDDADELELPADLIQMIFGACASSRAQIFFSCSQRASLHGSRHPLQKKCSFLSLSVLIIPKIKKDLK